MALSGDQELGKCAQPKAELSHGRLARIENGLTDWCALE